MKIKSIREITNLPYYLFAIGLFVLLKFVFTLTDTDDLIFLIKPTDRIIGLLTGAQSLYLKGTGYYYEQLDVVIEKSCSGFNFLLLCFLSLVFASVKYFQTTMHKIIAIFCALSGAYFFTILANSSRIYASLIIHHQSIGFIQNNQSIIHQVVGIINNLFYLILIFLIVEKLLKHRQEHAKLI